MPTPPLFNLKSTVTAVILLQRMTKYRLDTTFSMRLDCVGAVFVCLHFPFYFYLFIY